MKKFEDAKSYYRKALEIDPNDPEPYYSVGVIDWTQTYQPRMEERAKLGMKPDEQLNPKDKNQKKTCDELKAEEMGQYSGRHRRLSTRRCKLRPDYDDAMAYMNLMYREKADVECDDLAQRRKRLEDG